MPWLQWTERDTWCPIIWQQHPMLQMPFEFGWELCHPLAPMEVRFERSRTDMNQVGSILLMLLMDVKRGVGSLSADTGQEAGCQKTGYHLDTLLWLQRHCKVAYCYILRRCVCFNESFVLISSGRLISTHNISRNNSSLLQSHPPPFPSPVHTEEERSNALYS